MGILEVSNRKKCLAVVNRKESLADSAKHFCHLQKTPFAKKRPVVVLGETRPVDPDKGCVGEVLGTEYFLPEQFQRPRVEAAFVATLSVYERPQGSPLQDVEPLSCCPAFRTLSIKINDPLSYLESVRKAGQQLNGSTS